MHILYICALFALPIWNSPESQTPAGHAECRLQCDASFALINQQTEPIPTNPTVFKKSPYAKLLIKSKINASACYIDIKKWSHGKPESNESEFVFQFKAAPIQAMMLCETNTAPLPVLRDAVLGNVQKIVPDIQITHQEYRSVNGQNVLQLEMTGTVQSYPIVYWGYLASGSTGATTWLAYGTQELIAQHKSDVETLMNGLVKQ